MNASLPVLSTKGALPLDPRTYDRALSCVHCGLCLPACPTYTITANESDSPRGRIQLMRGLAEGVIEPTESVRKHLDLCLDCRACETACPSGVVYHELIEETRARLAPEEKPSLQSRLMQWMFFHIFTHPTRLKLLLLPARILQRSGLYGLLRRTGVFRLLPLQWQKMEQMLPAGGSLWPRQLRSAGSKIDVRNTQVGFFTGCVGAVLFDEVNRKSVELLETTAEVVVAPRQVCCGAIHHHSGDHATAQMFARKNIDAFLPPDQSQLSHIVTSIAGCGAMLREYDILLRDDPAYCERAREFSSRVRDVSEVMLERGMPEMKHPVSCTATYHDACHLAHAQKVTAEPRTLLAKVPGLRLISLPESDMCCGAAGTYNLTQPAMATQLADRKMDRINGTGAQICITGNAGCALQIQSAAHARGSKVKVMHPVEILHQAIFGGAAASPDIPSHAPLPKSEMQPGDAEGRRSDGEEISEVRAGGKQDKKGR